MGPKSSGTDRLRVLLTGAGGKVGSCLAQAFRTRYHLRTFDCQPLPDDPESICGDLQDYSTLAAAMEGIDVLVHLAAYPNEAPFIETLLPSNIIGAYNAFEAARECGVRRVVFASTMQTVGGYPLEAEYIEPDDPPRPSSVYAATKLFGEALGRHYHAKHGMEVVLVRMGWFQPYDSELLRTNDKIRRLWLSPDDAAQLYGRAVEQPDVGCVLVFGTSITEHPRTSLKTARDRLGYEPQDNIADIPRA